MDFIKANEVCDEVRGMNVETAIPTICMCCDIVAAKAKMPVSELVSLVSEMTASVSDALGEYAESEEV